MTDTGNIMVENKLIVEKRAISVYHHASRGAHLISHNGSVMIPLKPDAEEDYLHISVITGPGRLKNDSLLDIPPGLDFEFSNDGKVVITYKGGRVLIKIPAGLPIWQLKLTRPTGIPHNASSAYYEQRITVGESEGGNA
ncbi:MAG: hypothetical protein QG657_1197 [Acidobacteriota bacterium]|nr:hypothetical protein [Acidobacteriota bacterium]